MPSYKTHSIHGEILLPFIKNMIEINEEDFKTFCIGPDTLLVTDSRIFNYQHSNNVKDYFMYLINYIKKNKLYENGEVMAFLYGQLDHYVLDTTIHPLIYYFTQFSENKYVIELHGLVEMWIDDYVCLKYGKNQKNYYLKSMIKDNKLKKLIDRLYLEIYNVRNEAMKYDLGIKLFNLFDICLRRNVIKIVPLISNMFNLGDITYQDNIDRVLPYLNLENDLWINPETGDISTESFDDLWNKSFEVAYQMYDDINNYIFLGRSLSNNLICNNISFNTGLPCEQGQKYTYVRRKKYIHR